MAVGSVPVSRATSVVVSLPKAMVWLFATVVLAMIAYYFIGLDEGMSSVFGKSMMVHEFVHDGRHLLGFPCH